MYGMISTATRGNRLSRAAISAAALAIVDRDGLDALTMRRLAGELDVAPMTLYGHVRDKDDLLDAVVEAAAERHWERPAGGPWQERIKAVARELHRGLLDHPALVELRLRRPIVTASALRGTEVAMQALVEAGFGLTEAARAFRVVFLYVFGAAAFNLPEVPDRRGSRGARRGGVPAAGGVPDRLARRRGDGRHAGRRGAVRAGPRRGRGRARGAARGRRLEGWAQPPSKSLGMATRRRKRRRSRGFWPPLELPTLEQRHWDLIGLGLVAFAAFFACVFYLGWAGGEVGEAMADGILFLFGGIGYLAPVALFAAGALIVVRPMLPAAHPLKTGAACLAAALTLGLAAGSLGMGPGDTPRDGFLDASYLREHGGLAGESLFWASSTLFSEAGSHILFVFLLLAGVLLVTGASIAGLMQATQEAATTTTERVRRTTRSPVRRGRRAAARSRARRATRAGGPGARGAGHPRGGARLG